MNGDSYKHSTQSSGGRVINRAGSTSSSTSTPMNNRWNEDPSSEIMTEPRSERNAKARSGDGYKSPKQSRGRWWLIVLSIILFGLAVSGWSLWFVSRLDSATTGLDSSRYQAVFLTNGQIYFGKMSDFNSTSFKMTEIYYPQPKADTTDTKETTNATNNTDGLQLIRLGDEVHGPENTMFLSKKQILYYENLKSDSKVSQLIEQNEASRK